MLEMVFPKAYTHSAMPPFWDETEFISYLEVLPEVDEERDSHLFRVVKDGVRLELDVWDYNNVSIRLYREGVERPLLELAMIPCSGTRYVNDPRGEYLEFVPSRVFEDNYYPDTLIPVGVRLSVKPSIQVEFFSV